ncbi:MAG: ABC-2 family transporter protein [Desulfobacteraceae bacterium]
MARSMGGCVSNSFQRATTYRVNLFLEFVGSMIIAIAAVYLWHAAFQTNDKVAGFEIGQMIIYIIYARAIARLLTIDPSEMASEQIETGNIVFYFIRPMHPLIAMNSFAFGSIGFQLVFFSLPSAWLLHLFFEVPAPQLSQYGAFFVFLILGLGIHLSICSLVTCINLYSKNVRGISLFRSIIVGFLSGAIIPTDLFPIIIQDCLKYLPFRYICEIPCKVMATFLISQEIHNCFILAIFWNAILWPLASFLWRFGTKQYEASGG